MSKGTKFRDGLARHLIASEPGATRQSLAQRVKESCAEFGQLDYRQLETAALLGAWKGDPEFGECMRRLQDRVNELPALIEKEFKLDKPNFSRNATTSATRWAPVLLEPIPGSEERIVIAIAAVNGSEVRCSQTIDPAIARAVFRDDRKYIADLIDIVTESLSTHLVHNKSLGQWPPPLEGVSLGSEQESRFSDIDELVRRAGSMSTVFHGEYFKPQSKDPKPVRWTDEVTSILVNRNERLKDHLDVRVHLGQFDSPAQFTFLDAFFAANLVTFSQSNLKRRVEQARAGLWNLSLLKDGPMLFRPERRELLAGIEFSDQTASANVREAIDEISDEASRRDVLVTELPSPEAVAEHILQHASAQA